jgi:hypothetical protein
MSDDQVRNDELLNQTVEWIRTHPAPPLAAAADPNRMYWDQHVYRYLSNRGIAMCTAAVAAELDGGYWLPNYPDFLYAKPTDPPIHVLDASFTDSVIHARRRAEQVLGLNETERYCLFNSRNNTLEILVEVVNKIQSNTYRVEVVDD